MTRAGRDAVVFGLAGLILGAPLGLLAAGGFATWSTGGDLAQIDLLTIVRFSPAEPGVWGEPFRTSAITGLGVWLAVVVLAIALGYRPAKTSHGSAAWATPAELRRQKLAVSLKELRAPIFAKLATPSRSGLYLTTDEQHMPHSLIVAPTRSGKGVGVIIPTLLTYPGSVICLDVKGENFQATARRRKQLGDEVFKFSPYDVEGRTHRYNPLSAVADAADRRRFTEARRLAASLIIAKSKGAEGFLEGAREIFAATCIAAIERGKPRLSAVYDLLSADGAGEASMKRLAKEIQSPEARSVFNRMAATEVRILSSYLSVLLEGGLSLWADPAVRDATNESDFSIGDARRQPLSIFLVVAPNDLEVLGPLMRLFFQQAVGVLQRSLPTEDEPFPVLFLMDEFHSLGRMDTLSTAITTISQYGGRFMTVVQALPNLKDIYGPEGAANFLSNSPMQVYMHPADADTPRFISEAIGDRTRLSRSKSWTIGKWGRNIQERAEGSPLIRPAELRNLDDETAVLLVRSTRPIKTHKVRYYADRALRKLYEGQTGPLPEPPSVFDPAAEAPALAQTSGGSDLFEIRPEPHNSAIARAKRPPEAEKADRVPTRRPKRRRSAANTESEKAKQADLLDRLKTAKKLTGLSRQE